MDQKINSIVISGNRLDDMAKAAQKESEIIEDLVIFQLGATRSGESETQDIDEDHIAEIEFEDGSVWIGPAPELPDYLGKEPDRSGSFVMPTSVSVSTDRGIKEGILKFLKLFKTKDLKRTTKELAKLVDSKLVKEEGLFHVNNDLSLGVNVKDKPLVAGQHYLLMIHGTASHYNGTFEDLIKDNNTASALASHYGGHVIALNHYTLSKSPIRNTIDLVKHFPSDIKLDIISGSRGGLIMDILSRFNKDNDDIGFHEDEFEFIENNGREDINDELRSLQGRAITMDISINKSIRVACPADGTSILSKKLDLFFNVVRNLIRAASGGSSLILKELGDIFIEFIKLKSDPKVLPGLEAMVPGTPMLKLLNQDKYKISTPLSIVYSDANIRGGILKGLAFILARLVFWRGNDFVVDTSSMFLGATRSGQIRGLEVRGNKVHHLSYYRQNTYVSSIIPELTGDYANSNFEDLDKQEGNRQAVIKKLPGKYKEKDLSYTNDVIILIPGILGSGLSEVSKRRSNTIWVDTSILFGIDKLNISNSKIEATHLIAKAYKQLGEYLKNQGYDVLLFPYDWRKPIEESGKLLKKKLKETHEKLDPTKSIKIIAHSMGGLVMRDVIANHPDIYKSISDRQGYKLLLLGTPWKGSLHIFELLLGQGERFGLFKKLTFNKTDKQLLDIFSEYTGAIQMLPFETAEGYDLADANDWKKIKKGYPNNKWSIPSATDLGKFYDYRNQYEPDDLDLTDVIYVAGMDDATADTFKITDDGSAVEFHTTNKGDSSVTWASGIPDNIQTLYFVDETHGELANNKLLFNGFLSLLEIGSTNDNNFFHSENGSEPRSGSSKRSIAPLPSHPVLPNDRKLIVDRLLGLKDPLEKKMQTYETDLTVTVSLGDLSKAEYPVMVGRFSQEKLRGAEKAIDSNLFGDMKTLMNLQLFPKSAYQTRYIPNRHTSNRLFKGGIIVGLGDKLKITGYILQTAITSAALNYAMEKILNPDSDGVPSHLGLSSVLMGSVYGQLSTEESLDSILKGITKANELLQFNNINVVFNQLEIIELYRERSEEIFLSLSRLKNSVSNNLNLDITPNINKKDGWLPSIPLQYNSDWYDQYTVYMSDKETGKGNIREMVFKAYQGLAREEFVKSYGSADLIEGLNDLAQNTDWNPNLFKALFEYLIPNTFKNSFKRQANIEFILDEETANFPWEMMLTDLSDKEPISVGASVIRRLTSVKFDTQLSFVTKRSAYLIGNPDSDYIDLPQAKVETDSIDRLLKDNSYTVDYPESDANKIHHMINLLSNEYKIIHIAAHGIYEEEDGMAKIIVGRGEYNVLTSYDFDKLPYTPDLVFINCCYLGKMDIASMDNKTVENLKKTYQDRFRIAPSLAKQLLQKGCKAVIVAGWPVADGAAKLFAEEFYKSMLCGDSFGVAIRKARYGCFTNYPKTNTWGAYQCYGNPDFELANNSNSLKYRSSYLIPKKAIIALQAFHNKMKFEKKSRKKLMESLEKISKKITNSGYASKYEIASLEASAYAELDMFEDAIRRYKSIIDEGKSEQRVKIFEQCYNLEIRQIVKNGIKNKENIERIDELIDKSIKLELLSSSSERSCLIGRAYMHKYMLTEDIKDLKKMSSQYLNALTKIKNEFSYKKYMYPLFVYLKAEHFEKGRQKVVNSKICDLFGISKKSSIEDLLKKIELDQESISGRSNFWIEISKMSLCQYELLRASRKDSCKELGESMKGYFDEAWIFGGTYRHRSTEIEHINFLIKGIERSKKKLTSMDKLKIDILRNLQKHILKSG